MESMSIISKLVDNETIQTLRSRYRLGMLLFAFWLVTLISAYLTFPFVEHTTKMENVIYGIIVSIPFLVLSIIYLFVVQKDIVEYESKASGKRDSK